MPSFKELKNQGLQGYPGPYPLPQLRADGKLVTVYQRVKWRGPLDAEIEYLEFPGSHSPSYTTNAPHPTPSPSEVEDFESAINPTTHEHMFGEPAPAVTYPPPPEKDASGNYPPRPDNLPPRPEKQVRGIVRERRFGELFFTERPPNEAELTWAENDYLCRLQTWKAWAAKMPRAWNLLSAEEFAALSAVISASAAEAEDARRAKERNAGGFFFLVIILLFIHFFVQFQPFVLALLLLLIFSPKLTPRIDIPATREWIGSFVRRSTVRALAGLVYLFFCHVDGIRNQTFEALKTIFFFLGTNIARYLLDPLDVFTDQLQRENIALRVDRVKGSLDNCKNDLIAELAPTQKMQLWIGIMAMMGIYSLAMMSENTMNLSLIIAAIFIFLTVPWMGAVEGFFRIFESYGNGNHVQSTIQPSPTRHNPTTATSFTGISHSDPLTTTPVENTHLMSGALGSPPKPKVHAWNAHVESETPPSTPSKSPLNTSPVTPPNAATSSTTANLQSQTTPQDSPMIGPFGPILSRGQRNSRRDNTFSPANNATNSEPLSKKYDIPISGPFGANAWGARRQPTTERTFPSFFRDGSPRRQFS